jgi:hypothetical protein
MIIVLILIGLLSAKVANNDFALAAVAGFVETNWSTKYKNTMIIKSYN